MTAYDEFVTPILIGANREKYEWAIGSALSGGPGKSLILVGNGGTGRSELMTITNRIFSREGMPTVIIRDGLRHMNVKEGYVFMSCLQPIEVTDVRYIVTQTSGYFHPEEDYYRLYEAMEAETDAISIACIARYDSMGPSAYEDLVVNNLPAEES